jgi:hypothetical protein
MNQTMQRRTFLAAGALSIPSIALAKSGQEATNWNQRMEFHKLMGQAGDHLKSMRGMMRDLDGPGARDDAGFLANEISVLLVQCIQCAEQVKIPKQSAEEYGDDRAMFLTDLRVKLTESALASVALSRAIWLKDDDEAAAQYRALRSIRKEGHDEFISEE